MGSPYDGVDLRKYPEAYRIGPGAQGVFHAEPYKSELLPLWRFKDVESAKESAEAIYGCFLDYKAEGDFVGMDVARKRSEEHTSELQSRQYLVCRLLLEKKKRNSQPESS